MMDAFYGYELCFKHTVWENGQGELGTGHQDTTEP
jgi:hypothetical protein